MISFYFTESDNDIQNSQLCVRAAYGNTLDKSSDNIQNVTGDKGQEGDKCHASGRNVLWKTEKGCSFANVTKTSVWKCWRFTNWFLWNVGFSFDIKLEYVMKWLG